MRYKILERSFWLRRLSFISRGSKTNKESSRYGRQLLEEESQTLEEPAFNIEHIAVKIIHFCQNNEAILNSDFRINELAKEIGTNRNYISKAINISLSTNFSQLRNYFRIKKACTIFIDKPNIDTDLLWKYSNFTSSSSYLNAFEKHIGTSPSKWYKEVRRRMDKGEKVSVAEYLKSLKYCNN